MLRRFSSAAVSGTTTERNITVSSRNDSRMTAERNSGRRSPSRSPMSDQVAVWPPTCARAGLPSRTAGKTCVRSRWIVAGVASSCGERGRVGDERRHAAVGLRRRDGGDPGVGRDCGAEGRGRRSARRRCRRRRPAGRCGRDRSRRRRDRRRDARCGCRADCPRRGSPGAGRAQARQHQQENRGATAYALDASTRARPSAPSVSPLPRRSRPPESEPVDPRPASPRNAGSKVTEAATMIRTTTEMATPTAVMNGMPATARPRIAITTVPPAKITAWPAVATARPAASSTVIPRARCSRCRVTRNSA